MSAWSMIRTDYRKETYVAAQIERHGFAAWVPQIAIHYRDAASRRGAGLKVKLAPLLPKRVFAAFPAGTGGNLPKVRHMVAMEHSAALEPLEIPDDQIATWKGEIDKLNLEVIALASISRTTKHRKRWKSLKEALEELVAGAKMEMEESA